ncbi:unnamed protein product, partial [Heligmosomoides polygyrus]|uniref:Tyrosinase_Cu-bd domain-containing protein n=1 Tax=Heligmosomoides polygyrus TaxID=6339 RepID=A0A183F8T3_HELPZ
MFYLHHAFVDYLWEQFRRKQQTREQRETQWAKVVLGGNCTGFEGTAICHNSTCKDNRCQLPPRLLQSMRLRKAADPPAGDYVWTKTLLIDQHGKGVRDDLAHVKVVSQMTSENTTVYQQSESLYPEIDLMTSTMITSLAENTRPPQSREPHVWFRVVVHRRPSQNLQVNLQ